MYRLISDVDSSICRDFDTIRDLALFVYEREVPADYVTIEELNEEAKIQ